MNDSQKVVFWNITGRFDDKYKCPTCGYEASAARIESEDWSGCPKCLRPLQIRASKMMKLGDMTYEQISKICASNKYCDSCPFNKPIFHNDAVYYKCIFRTRPEDQSLNLEIKIK